MKGSHVIGMKIPVDEGINVMEGGNELTSDSIHNNQSVYKNVSKVSRRFIPLITGKPLNKGFKLPNEGKWLEKIFYHFSGSRKQFFQRLLNQEAPFDGISLYSAHGKLLRSAPSERIYSEAVKEAGVQVDETALEQSNADWCELAQHFKERAMELERELAHVRSQKRKRDSSTDGSDSDSEKQQRLLLERRIDRLEERLSMRQQRGQQRALPLCTPQEPSSDGNANFSPQGLVPIVPAFADADEAGS